MPTTYETIATTTLVSSQSTITFSSIPGTYTDLRLNFVGTNASTGNSYIQLKFNGSSTGYSQTGLAGDGSSALSWRFTSQTYAWIGGAYSNLSNTIPTVATIDILSYAGSNNKTFLAMFNGDKNGSGSIENTVNLWANTSAITSISLTGSSVQFASGTTATLYGILKA